MASGGRLVAALAAMAAVALLLAGGADANCFDYCFKNCVGNDKSMADYCNYACGKTCDPGVLRQQQHRPLAAVVDGLPVRCQIDCVKRSCTGFRKDRNDMVGCYRVCFDGCNTKPAPITAPVSETKSDDANRPSSEPEPYTYDAAAVPDHPFHEKQPSTVPDHP